MSVLIKGTSPAVSFEMTSAVTVSAMTTLAVMHKFKAINNVVTPDTLSTTNGSFGYQLGAIGTGGLTAKWRTNTQNTTSTIKTGIVAGSTITVFTKATLGDSVKHYVDGVLSVTLADAGSSAWVGSTLRLKLGGSTAARNYEYIESAVWLNTAPTDTDIANYQAGAALSALSVPPTHAWKPEGPNGQYVPSLLASIGAMAMPGAGTNPTTGGLEPVYSGAVDSLALDYSERFIQRNSVTGVARTFTGTYTGTIAEPLQVRATKGGSPLPGLDWQTASYTIGGGVFSVIFPEIPTNTDVVLQVRDSAGTPIVGSSGLITIGDIFHLYGQSNAEQFSSSPTVPTVPDAACWVHDDGSWKQDGSVNQRLVNSLKSRLGIPCAVVNAAQGGTAISLLVPGSAHWNANVAPRLVSLGDFAGAVWGHGESDVNTAAATYKASLSSILNGYLAINGRTPTNFKMLLWDLGVNTGNADTTIWPAMRRTQLEWCNENPTVAMMAAHPIDGAMLDSLHYTTDFKALLAERVAKSYAFKLGLVASNGEGPKPTGFSIDGSNVIVAVDLNGGTSITKGAGNLTGWQVYTNDTFAAQIPITSSTITDNKVVLTLATPPTEAAIVRYLWAADPVRTNMVIGTGYDIANIGMGMSQIGYALPFNGSVGSQKISISLSIGL